MFKYELKTKMGDTYQKAFEEVIEEMNRLRQNIIEPEGIFKHSYQSWPMHSQDSSKIISKENLAFKRYFSRIIGISWDSSGPPLPVNFPPLPQSLFYAPVDEK